MSFERVAWLLVVEGIPWCWTSQEALAGTGASSWIGTDHGARIVRPGLILPESIRTEVRISAGPGNGQLDDDGADFQVIDTAGDLLALFAVPTAPQLLGARLAPTDDPAPQFGVDHQSNAVLLWGRYVGHEAIGPAGERRYYPCIPGTLPGPDHAALNETAQIAPVEVTDGPQYREGRRVALYLLRRDPHGRRVPERDNWPSWSDQIEGGALVWWGKLRRGACQGKRWRLPCDGPASWLAKQLNANAPSEWRTATPLIELSTAPGLREDTFAIVLTTRDGDNQSYNFHGQEVFQNSFTATPQLNDIVTLLSNTVEGLLSEAGPDGVFKDQFGANAEFNLDAVKVSITKQGLLATGASMRITMHSKVWALLGWEPAAQTAMIPSDDDSPFAAGFNLDADVQTPGLVKPPGPGYWTLYADTWKPAVGDVLNDWDNEGAARTYQPLSGAGALALSPAGDQELSDGYPPGEYIEGQLARPPTPGAEVDGTATDTMRWALFGMMRRTEGQDEAEELRAVARIEWASGDSPTFTPSGESDLRYRIVRWYDPRYFGHPDKSFAGDVALPLNAPAEQSLRMVPLAVFGYDGSSTGLDNVVHILGRLLLSTGTARWEDGELVVGGNHHPDALASGLNDDTENADLGLAIPASLVDLRSFAAAAALNPGGVGGPLNKVRLAYIGPVAAADILATIMGPRHWAWSLRGNRYGLFAWTEPLRLEDVDVAIGTSDVAGDSGPPPVDLRPVAPIDRATVTFGHAERQLEASEFKVSVASRDAGRPARNGRHEVVFLGRGLPVPERWTLLEEQPPQSWQPDWSTLWATRIGPWAASPMISVRVTVRPPKALRCQVGSIVRFTNPWPATARGVFGLTNALGRITSVELDTRNLCATISVLLQDRDATLSRRFAPIARVVDDVATAEERYDPDTKTLFCQADAFERGLDPDVRYFAEPGGLNIGGAAKIEVWQWNRSRWAKTLTGTVASVDEETHSITLSAASGTFKNREYAIVVMQPYLDQDESGWVRAFFLPTTAPDGTFDGGDATGFQFTK